MLPLRYAIDGFPSQTLPGVKQSTCRRMSILDSPSGSSGAQPSNYFHRKPCCVLPMANPLLLVLHETKHQGTQEHPPCPHGLVRVPVYTSNCNNWAQVVSESRTNRQSPRFLL